MRKWPNIDELRLPGWAIALSVVGGLMAGAMFSIIESATRFGGQSSTHLVVVFLISSVVAFVLIYVAVADLRAAPARRAEVARRFENMTDRAVWLWAIGFLVLLVVWAIRTFGWLWN